ncbi:PRTRC genetic system protein E [Paraburkholderia terricola]|uniref:PRTRC system protein E n=1 Tax=Paraburkholderia terricola TaxID=169427 RepID=UPI002867097D|nr:PRTRC system protein E [Paraburkholderia terricola]MDR6447440.1 PRTRC genetic system protein E [Paraburkholderia terricola]
MSLFASLHPLAKRTTLTLLITAEGDQLRVNVTPRANDDTKGEKPLYPLSILATPEELDRDFAEAVSIYEPSTLSVLEQARVASAANGTADAVTKALPAPAATAKGKGSRKRAAEQPAPTDNEDEGGGAGDTPPADPRQTQIPGIDPDAEPATAETPAVVAEQDSSNAQPAVEEDGVDLL